MSFYLKAPRGVTNIHTLEECVSQRLICYEHIISENFHNILTNSEYLIEDSSLDRTGHYLLRLVAFCSPTFRDVFIEKECKLLQERVKHLYDIENIKLFLRKLRQHSCFCVSQVDEGRNKIREYFFVLLNVCTQILNKENLKYVIPFKDKSSKTEAEEMYVQKLKVPFYFCSDLVATRSVEVDMGYVTIDLKNWKTLLLALFKTYLIMALKEMEYCENVQNALEDERMIDIIDFVNRSYIKETDHGYMRRGRLDVNKINEESKVFPLCMQSLFSILLKNNRLSHNARFDFSLYMKGIGISMSDSLYFWENIYSKEHASCSKCTHNWQKNTKRYTYGIRHLYGLEGSRKNYGVRSCHFLQEVSLGANDEGGCPYSHFDDRHLRDVLKKQFPIMPSNDLEVIIHSRKESPTTACKMVLEHKMQLLTKGNSTKERKFYNPVQYYFLIKQSIETKSDELQ